MPMLYADRPTLESNAVQQIAAARDSECGAIFVEIGILISCLVVIAFAGVSGAGISMRTEIKEVSDNLNSEGAILDLCELASGGLIGNGTGTCERKGG